jgi:hypothetical protein
MRFDAVFLQTHSNQDMHYDYFTRIKENTNKASERSKDKPNLIVHRNVKKSVPACLQLVRVKEEDQLRPHEASIVDASSTKVHRYAHMSECGKRSKRK